MTKPVDGCKIIIKHLTTFITSRETKYTFRVSCCDKKKMQVLDGMLAETLKHVIVNIS